MVNSPATIIWSRSLIAGSIGAMPTWVSVNLIKFGKRVALYWIEIRASFTRLLVRIDVSLITAFSLEN